MLAVALCGWRHYINGIIQKKKKSVLCQFNKYTSQLSRRNFFPPEHYLVLAPSELCLPGLHSVLCSWRLSIPDLYRLHLASQRVLTMEGTIDGNSIDNNRSEKGKEWSCSIHFFGSLLQGCLNLAKTLDLKSQLLMGSLSLFVGVTP